MKRLKRVIQRVLEKVFLWSLQSAAREQGIDKMSGKLNAIVPDISGQYSTFRVDSEYLKKKIRNQHAFQVSLLENVMKDVRDPMIVDVGDSSGAHLKYISALYGKSGNIRCLSVNMDGNAINKIRQGGGDAILTRAEDLPKHDISADIFLCFEILEHLTDPHRFLYNLSTAKSAKYLIATVPYLRKSRVGLHHIRRKDTERQACAENTHLFELSPEDWKLIAKHSGWEVAEERRYLQYPGSGIWRLTKYLWKKFDFEGFYGMVLKPNDKWTAGYPDYREGKDA